MLDLGFRPPQALPDSYASGNWSTWPCTVASRHSYFTLSPTVSAVNQTPSACSKMQLSCKPWQTSMDIHRFGGRVVSSSLKAYSSDRSTLSPCRNSIRRRCSCSSHWPSLRRRIVQEYRTLPRFHPL